MAKKRTIADLIKDEFKQQSLFYIDAYKEADAGSDWVIDSCYGATYDLQTKPKKGSCVPENKPTHEPTHEPKYTCWVQTYWVSRRGTKHQYYRFCYLTHPGEIGSCVRVHLPGGNTKSDRALLLKEKVESAIAQGNSPTQIITLIQSEKLLAVAVAPRQKLP
ncbi:hypothetical protein [Chlorogloea sp. CCALA 695]|uniref:hypothetical protein n=1 Tax=Chlorogloea sp. CCALA 695 TaxID=2107693 RepID=UPI000D0685FF|nr:hypothetical protein [Chlorogloea sp. CCALA 695]PSB27463.1 hypothetical protein C7B70_22435 [Chlorogloea sp. CCALA 695]